MLCVLIRIPLRGDSNEYTQRTIIVQKIDRFHRISDICFPTWRHY